MVAEKQPLCTLYSFHCFKGKKLVFGILWGVVVLLFVFWIAGFALHIAGGLIHLLLVLAIALAIYNFAMNRDARQ